MCGIIGYIGSSNSYNICIDSLKQLQNRGYDSAGICSLLNENFKIYKFASKTKKSALDRLEIYKSEHDKSILSIGHTRWATHGAKNDINSHPHISSDGLFTLVHNGIIENYKMIKKMLKDNGYTFKSETDSEVVVNLLSYFYNKNGENVTKAIQSSIEILEGTWGLAILCKKEPNKLYATRHGSPILIGMNDNGVLITSENSGFCNLATNYFVLQNNDIAIIQRNEEEINILTNKIYKYKSIEKKEIVLNPEPYPHWTIKEINEQSESCLRAISLGGRLMSNNEVKLGGLEKKRKELLKLDNIILLGCGTSYNAGMFGLQYFKEFELFNNVQLFDGADFNSNDISKKGKTGLILLSQSGETKDLHRCIEIGRSKGLFIIGVVNVVDSLIAREVDCGCYLNAGREVAVASTKAYTSQIILLCLIAIWFSQEKNINNSLREKYIKNLRNLHKDIRSTIELSESSMEEIVPLFKHHSCFILGKGKCESVAKEGALKIKEISYIHAEGYSTSSLKHGPFALLHNDFPVVLLALDNEHYQKNENAYEEIKSRHASIIFITDKDVNRDNMIKITYNESFQDLLSIIPIQILAYRLSLERKLNPDMPRNLAKVVTVE